MRTRHTLHRIALVATMVAAAIGAVVPSSPAHAVGGGVAANFGNPSAGLVPYDPDALVLPPAKEVTGRLSFEQWTVPAGYSFREISRTGTHMVLQDSQARAWLYTVDGGHLTELSVTDWGGFARWTGTVAWSTDGTKIAYQLRDYIQGLYVYDIPTQTRTYFNGGGSFLMSSMSDDGRYVLVNHSNGGFSRVDLTTGTAEAAFFDPATGAKPAGASVNTGPALSGDGRYFVASITDAPSIDPTDTNGVVDIYRFDIDGDTADRLVFPNPDNGRVVAGDFLDRARTTVVARVMFGPTSSYGDTWIAWNLATGTTKFVYPEANQNVQFIDGLVIQGLVPLRSRGTANTNPSSHVFNSEKGVRVWNLDRGTAEWHHQLFVSTYGTVLLDDGRLFLPTATYSPLGVNGKAGFWTGLVAGPTAVDPAAIRVNAVPDRAPDTTDGRYTSPVTVSWTVDDATVTPPPPVAVTVDGLAQPIVSDTVCNATGSCAFGATRVSLDAVTRTDTYDVDRQVLYERTIRRTNGDSYGSVVGIDLAAGSTTLLTDNRRLVSGLAAPVLSQDNSTLLWAGSMFIADYGTTRHPGGFECFTQQPVLSPVADRLLCDGNNRHAITDLTGVADSGPYSILDFESSPAAISKGSYQPVWLDGDVMVGWTRYTSPAGFGSCPGQGVELERRQIRSGATRHVLAEICDITGGDLHLHPDGTTLVYRTGSYTPGAPPEIRFIGVDGTNDRTILSAPDLGATSISNVIWNADGTGLLALVQRGNQGRALVAVDPVTGAYNDLTGDYLDPVTGERTTIGYPAGGTATVHVPTTIRTPILQTIRTGISFTQRLYATGGAGPWRFTVTDGALPPGITLDPSTGVLFGYASSVATGDVTITATDTRGETGSRTYALDVTQVNTIPVVSANGPYTVPAGGTRTVSASTTDADGDPVDVTWDLNGDGTTDATGTSATFDSTGYTVGDQITIAATGCDPYGACGRGTTTVTVISPVSITTGEVLPEGRVGESYHAQIEATGGTLPYTWTITGGTVPPGLTLDTEAGTITGTPTAAGTFGFTLTVTDANGATASRPFTTAPAPTVGDPGTSYTNPIVITPPAGDGPTTPTCDSYALAVDSDPLPAGLALDSTTGTISGTPTTGGTYTIVVDCTYSTGGGTAVESGEFTITISDDSTPPVVVGVPSRSPDRGIWWRSTVTINWVVTDDSGAATTPPSVVVDGDGAGQGITSAPACDPTGNCATGTYTVNLDRTSPTVTPNTDRPANDQGWWNAPVTWAFECADSTSGVDTCPSTAAFNDEGTSTDSVAGTDKAGNTTTVTVTSRIDTIPPAVTLTSVDDGATIRDSDEIAPTCAATDSTSGVDGSCVVTVLRAPATAGAETVTVTALASDVAGNDTSITRTYTVIVDGDAPVITTTRDVEPNTTGWWNTPVTYDFSCEDPSGVETCPSPITFGTDGASQSATVTATDVWGNAATASVAGVNVDLTSPALTFVGAETAYDVDDRIVIGCDATDATSGVASIVCPTLDVDAVDYGLGIHVLTATAADVAGNTTTTTWTLEVAPSTGGLKNLVADYLGEGPGTTGLYKSFETKIDQGSWDAFVAEVEAKCCTDNGGNGKGKRFTRRQADLLITIARLLEDQ